MFTQTYKRVSDLDTDLDIVKNNSTSLERLNNLVTDLLLVKWNNQKPLENEPFISDFKLFEENVNNSEIANNVRNLIVATYFIVDQCIDLYIIERLLIEDKYPKDSDIYIKAQTTVMDTVFGSMRALLNKYSKKLLNIVYNNTFNEKFKNECINRYSIKDDDPNFTQSFLSFAKSPENTRFIDYMNKIISIETGTLSQQEGINQISSMLRKFYSNEPYWIEYFSVGLPETQVTKQVAGPSKIVDVIDYTQIETYSQVFLQEKGMELLEHDLDTSKSINSDLFIKKLQEDVSKALKQTFIDDYAKENGLSYPVNSVTKENIVSKINKNFEELEKDIYFQLNEYTGVRTIIEFSSNDRYKNKKALVLEMKEQSNEALYNGITSLFDLSDYKTYLKYSDDVNTWISDFILEVDTGFENNPPTKKDNDEAFRKYKQEYLSILNNARQKLEKQEPAKIIEQQMVEGPKPEDKTFEVVNEEIKNTEISKPVAQPVVINPPVSKKPETRLVGPVQKPVKQQEDPTEISKLQLIKNEPIKKVENVVAFPLKDIVPVKTVKTYVPIDESKAQISKLVELVPPVRDVYKIINKVGAKDMYQYEKHVYEYLKVLQSSSIFSIFKHNVEFSDNLAREKIIVNNVPVSNDEYMNSIITDAGNIIFHVTRDLELLTQMCNIRYKSTNAANDATARRSFYDNTLKAFRKLYAEYFTTFLPEINDLIAYLKSFDKENNGKQIKGVPPIDVIVAPGTYPEKRPVSKRNELFKTLLYRRSILQFVTDVGIFDNKIYQTSDSTRIGNVGFIRNITLGKKLRYVGCLPVKDEKCLPQSVTVIADIRQSETPNEITIINVNARYMYQISRLLITGLVQNFAYGYFYTADNKFEVITTSKQDGSITSKRYINNASLFITESLDTNETVTLEAWIARGRSIPEVLSVYFQIFHALYSLYEQLELVYYNIQPTDVFIVPVYACGYWRYVIDGVSYDIPNYGFMPLIYGYDSITTSIDKETAKSRGMSLTQLKMQAFVSLTSPVLENELIMLALKKYQDLQDLFKIGTFAKLRNYLTGFDWKRDIFSKFVFFTNTPHSEKNIIDVIGDATISNDITKYLNVTRDTENKDLFGFSEFDDLAIYEYKHDDIVIQLDKYGFDSQGYNSIGYNKFGYDKSGYDVNGYDLRGFNKSGFDKEGYDKNGYDIQGFNRMGLNKYGYDKYGYNLNGYSKYGFDRKGYNILGINVSGFTNKGIDRYGYNKYGYNEKGYDVSGFDQSGFDYRGVNKLNFGKEGFNEQGLDVWGKQKGDYNEQSGYDSEGFNKEGYNSEGYDRAGFDSEGYDRDGYDRTGYNKEGYSRSGAIKTSSATGKVYFRK